MPPPPRPEYAWGIPVPSWMSATSKFYRVKELTRRLGEVETSIYRRPDAIQKDPEAGQRFTEHCLPCLDGTIRFITDALERRSGRSFARLKVIKRVTTKQK